MRTYRLRWPTHMCQTVWSKTNQILVRVSLKCVEAAVAASKGEKSALYSAYAISARAHEYLAGVRNTRQEALACIDAARRTIELASEMQQELMAVWGLQMRADGYSQLSEVENPVDNLGAAIDDLQTALERMTQTESASGENASLTELKNHTLSRLASTYSNLSQYQDREANRQKAKDYLSQVRPLVSGSVYPGHYLWNESLDVDIGMKDPTAKAQDLTVTGAIAFYRERCDSLRSDGSPSSRRPLCSALLNLSDAYQEEAYNRFNASGLWEASLTEAQNCAAEAEALISFEKWPIDYARAKYQQGMLEYDSGRYTRNAEALRRGIACLRAALKTYSAAEYPWRHGEVMMFIGHIYAEIDAQSPDSAAKADAISCFGEALRYLPEKGFQPEISGIKDYLASTATS